MHPVLRFYVSVSVVALGTFHLFGGASYHHSIYIYIYTYICILSIESGI
jgi:hypothetical protein